MAIVMPRSRSSGALSILSKGVKSTFGLRSWSTFVMAAVSVVFPWSMWPIVPMFTCGLFRSNFCFDMPSPSPLAARGRATNGRHNLFLDRTRHFLIRVELHRVCGTPLCAAAQFRCVTEHLREWDLRLDYPVAPALVHRLDATPSPGQVADDVAHMLLGGYDLDVEDGLEKHRLRLAR